MMRYALLVCADENIELTAEDAKRQSADFLDFQLEMENRGVLVARERLQPTYLSTTVRLRGDRVVIADGPFAETKEQIAGFYVVECIDLDQAIEIAAKNPNAWTGTIEIRPVWEL